jgi:methyl-accepting chemotaxis protein
MDNAHSIKTIGVVGGGKVGLHLLELFGNSKFSKVAFITDINANAPAMVEAQKKHVPIFTDLLQALKVPTDFIFEVTGNSKVAQILAENLDQAVTRLITHEMAQIILEVVSESDQKVKSASVDEIENIKSEILSHMDRLGQFVKNIEGIMSELNMLAINARIEAARVGEEGRGFMVVAAEMGKSANYVRQITDEISQIVGAIGLTSNKIDESLLKLK